MIARLMCRLLGCTLLKLTAYDHGKVRTGEGCTRCKRGEVKEFTGRYPQPKTRSTR